LRSKETPKIDSSLFNFEQNPNAFDPSQVLTIVEEKNAGVVIQGEEVPSKIEIKTVIKEVSDSEDGNLEKTRRRSFRKNTLKSTNLSIKDSLDDEVYLPYHRRMEKEEKKMTNRDREKIHSEADKMKSQLESLQSTEWHKVLPIITYVRDPKNITEMSEKRQWTIDCLNGLLSKFDDWKKREDRVMGRNRSHIIATHTLLNDLRLYTRLNKYDYIGTSDTDEEEEDVSIEEIRRRRIRKRTEDFGPVIKIKFGGNVVVAEPFKATRIDRL
jgi:something-about-silencing protein 4